jgi:flagellar hook protein FlgE
MDVTFTRQGVNLWRAQFNLADASNVTVDSPGGPENATNILYFSFNRNGSLAAVSDTLPDAAPAQLVEGEKVFANMNFTLPDGTTSQFQLNFGTAGLVDGVTQFDSKSTTKAVDQDGYGMGYLQAFTIDSQGNITGVFTNDQKRLLGQVAMASFTNPGGLEKSGSNYYRESNNSGNARISAAGTEDKGTMRSGALEMSNVDLSEEFTDMIVTQRGYQANSRVITTSDQMLQELLSLKR